MAQISGKSLPHTNYAHKRGVSAHFSLTLCFTEKEMKQQRLFIVILAMAMVCLQPAWAQKRGKAQLPKGGKNAIAKQQPSTESLLYQELLPATAKLMFIDSLVVDKATFLQHIPFNEEMGTMGATATFVKKKIDESFTTFVNGFGNYAILAQGDSTHSALYSSDKLQGKWTTPERLAGVTDEFLVPNNPFMQSDGVTLYFGAKGSKSVGGYDLFMTRYNLDEQKFMPPENMGLPYNSKANDYLLAIDEFHELGWLVTDRNQPADKVCIYVFEPKSQRITYADMQLPKTKLESFAQIASIKDTWMNGNRNAALLRLKNLMKSKNKK